MKKLFLTSGVVLCLACPAFADTTNLTYNGSTWTEAGACTEPYLGTTSGSVSFEPIWENNTYSVTYATDAMGTSSDPLTETGIEYDVTDYIIKAEGSTTGITSNTGYHFTGWLGSSTDTNYVPDTYQPTNHLNPYQIAGNLTLTAQHAANETTVNYTCSAPSTASKTVNSMYTDGEGTAGSVPQSNVATFAQEFSFRSNTCTLEGYTFDNWACIGAANTTGLESTYASGATVNSWAYTGSHEGEISCSATWTPVDYTITYNCGAAKSGSASATTGPTTASDTIAMDGTYVLAANTNCTLPGYTFAGWDCPNLPGTAGVQYTDYDGTTQSTIFAAEATAKYTYAGNVTCTAKWTQNTIELTWYNDTTTNGGGTAISVTGTAAEDCTYDNGLALPSNPSKTGYTFKGWTVRSATPAQQTQQSGGSGTGTGDNNGGTVNEEPTTPVEEPEPEQGGN